MEINFTIVSYAKEPEIKFGRNGKQNMAENPFARSDRRERKVLLPRTMDFQTNFAGSEAQN